MTNDLFSRSIEIIKANQAAGGAYMASPNFEQYHYCWFRDGAYTAYAMDLAGEHESAARFYDWAAGNIAGRASQVGRAVAAAAQGPNARARRHTAHPLHRGWRGRLTTGPTSSLTASARCCGACRRHLDLTGRTPDAVPAAWREAVTLLVQVPGRAVVLALLRLLGGVPGQLHTYTLASSTAVCGLQPRCSAARPPDAGSRSRVCSDESSPYQAVCARQVRL